METVGTESWADDLRGLNSCCCTFQSSVVHPQSLAEFVSVHEVAPQLIPESDPQLESEAFQADVGDALTGARR